MSKGEFKANTGYILRPYLNLKRRSHLEQWWYVVY
jgi:hypothetical protein